MDWIETFSTTILELETSSMTSETALIEGTVHTPLGSSEWGTECIRLSPDTTGGKIFYTHPTWKSIRLYPLVGGDPSPSTPRLTTVIAIAVEPSKGYGEGNITSSGDLWLLLQMLHDILQDPSAIIYILTERLDVSWLGDFKASIVLDTPTRANMELAMQIAASRCAPEGNCLLWMCCDGYIQKLSNGLESSVLKSSGGGPAVNGKDLRSWTSSMFPSCTLTVILEVCNAGNFMNLPYEFAVDGTSLPCRPTKYDWGEGPHIICIAACRASEFAHFGWVGEGHKSKKCGAFSLMLKCLRSKSKHAPICLKDISRLVAPLLARWPQGQHPVVTMSYQDQNALLELPGFE